MKSRFWRAAAVAVVLATCSAQVVAGGHRHYHGSRYYGGAGWWVGGALLGAGVALALSSGPRYAYSGVTYVSPPVVYPGPTYVAPAYVAPSYVAPSVTYVTPAPVVTYAPPRLAVAPSSLNVVAYPAKGQSESQQMQDRQACENWAMNQSGLNPSNITEYTTTASADSYTRALGACFKGRGYSIN
ncbi:hypothetical protein [Bordetella sp. 02P26C-1]|uniref:hypothetical protein n=1 Tax=Bordetella sp. 02P26C-1 TaxID=2683195 RepID=UPI0013532036|nr:hypothetical protein [Bordetella sp. 02P26C-1]MVW79368.1 hypothetical protein [Bordetella sp. 02P26C-1]